MPGSIPRLVGLKDGYSSPRVGSNPRISGQFSSRYTDLGSPAHKYEDILGSTETFLQSSPDKYEVIQPRDEFIRPKDEFVQSKCDRPAAGSRSDSYEFILGADTRSNDTERRRNARTEAALARNGEVGSRARNYIGARNNGQQDAPKESSAQQER